MLSICLMRVVSMQATAALDSASQSWITSRLGQTHYGAYIHQASFTLIPGLGSWSGGCDGGGTCTGTGQALKVPFAIWNLQFTYEWGYLRTHFMSISITHRASSAQMAACRFM